MDGVIFSGEIFWRKMFWHDLAGVVVKVVVAVKVELGFLREEQRRLDWHQQDQLVQSL